MAPRTIPIPLNGGINTYFDPMSIGDDEAVEGKNLFPNVSGALALRPGIKPSKVVLPFNAFAGSPPQVVGAAPVPPNTGFKFAFLLVGDGQPALFATTPSGKYPSSLDYTTTDTTNIDTWAEGVQPCFVQYLGELYCFVGSGNSHAGYYRLRRDVAYEGGAKWIRENFDFFIYGAAGVFYQKQDIPVSPRVACVYRGRMVMADFGPGHEGKLTMADRGYQWMPDPPAAPTAGDDANKISPVALVGDYLLSLDGRTVDVGDQGCPRITGLASIQLVGISGEGDAALYVMGERALFVCKGEFFNTTDTPPTNEDYAHTFQVARSSVNAGCASHQTIVTTDRGTIWAGPDDVWIVDREMTPRAVGTKIRNILQSVPASLRKKWNATFFDGVYRLNIAVGNDPLSLGDGEDAEHAVRYESYWLDLRNGAPGSAQEARWFGPMVYKPMTWVGGSNEVAEAYLSNFMVVTDAQGEQALECLVNGTYWFDAGNPSNIITEADVTNTEAFDYGTIVADVCEEWQASREYFSGDVVRPTHVGANGFIYICDTAGTSGGSEPTWGTPPGSTADGGVTWTALGPNDALYFSRPGQLSGNEIIPSRTTKDFDFGDPMANKLLVNAEISAAASERQQLSIDVIRDQGRKSDTIESRWSNGGGSLGSIILDSDTGSLADEHEPRTIELDDSDRIVAHHMQFRLEGGTAITVSEGQNTSAEEFAGDDRALFPNTSYPGGTNSKWSHNLNRGVLISSLDDDAVNWSVFEYLPARESYATMEEFVDAVVAALNAGLTNLATALNANGFSSYVFANAAFTNHNCTAPGTDRPPLIQLRMTWTGSPASSNARIVINGTPDTYIGTHDFLNPVIGDIDWGRNSLNLMALMGFEPDNMEGVYANAYVFSPADAATLPWTSPKTWTAQQPVADTKPVLWSLNAMNVNVDQLGAKRPRRDGPESG